MAVAPIGNTGQEVCRRGQVFSRVSALIALLRRSRALARRIHVVYPRPESPLIDPIMLCGVANRIGFHLLEVFNWELDAMAIWKAQHHRNPPGLRPQFGFKLCFHFVGFSVIPQTHNKSAHATARKSFVGFGRPSRRRMAFDVIPQNGTSSPSGMSTGWR